MTKTQREKDYLFNNHLIRSINTRIYLFFFFDRVKINWTILIKIRLNTYTCDWNRMSESAKKKRKSWCIIMQTRKREHLFSLSLSLFISLVCHRIRKWIVTIANICISALVSSSSEQAQPWKYFYLKDIYYLWAIIHTKDMLKITKMREENYQRER